MAPVPKFICPRCESYLPTRETRGEARRRVCVNEHVYYTNGSEFCTLAQYRLAERQTKARRANRPPEPSPLAVLKTGHLVYATAQGLRYTMK